MSPIILDWNAIRPLNGSRANGFEELCTQLAQVEYPAGARFERKGTPDGGVECYAVLQDGTEWGWQAKYIDNLGDTQWKELDNSVATAIKKHPKLVRYFVCVPLDRPDGRIKKQKSAMEKWDTHVEKWVGWAATQGVTIEFSWQGGFEILERLSQPRHVGRVRFWFDVRGFDTPWFQARLDEARKTAGPRYTPEIHVDLPISLELEAFGRTQAFFDRVKSTAKGLRQAYKHYGYSKRNAGHETFDAIAADVDRHVESVIDQFGDLSCHPIGDLPLQGMADQIKEALTQAYGLDELLRVQAGTYQAANPKAAPDRYDYGSQGNPFRERQTQLARLCGELRETKETLTHAHKVASSALMILHGDAGTGKTHLLCDVARRRIEQGLPTVLLMGQQFLSTSDPWSQALPLLDLASLSIEEFVGALEAAAQVANTRALVMIDAVNEGMGRIIWPQNLASFLAHLERSPWIGVLLSIRTSYLQRIIPEDIRGHAFILEHEGFAEHEYDAVREFFTHYGLELPSTPILAPEFSNPLFLKTLCKGLKAKGEPRLPRGFQGITAAFGLYISSVNDLLAEKLDYHKKINLVAKAIEAFALTLQRTNQRWLPIQQAMSIVDALLPGKGLEFSLYQGLLSEGLLVEEVAWLEKGTNEDVTFIAYDRLADHLIAKAMLDAHLHSESPGDCFADGGPFSFLWEESGLGNGGLLEALCIQVPERVGRELVTLAPLTLELWEIGDAFRQSIVWRAVDAFSDETRETVNTLMRSEQDRQGTLDALLTVATLPGHPFNAKFLDQRLRKDTMPDRDAWWSILLHHAWGEHGAVDRLVHWASTVTPLTVLDPEAVDLCSIALAWMFTSSNRFLRDRATKALVNLLTDRLEATLRLLDRFGDVDDPYVVERVYAVVYGVAMRSQDVEKIGRLAKGVYDRVFAIGEPPAHILLRDYARGVVERALYLGSALEIDLSRIRPPYQSTWPTIPSEAEVKTLKSSKYQGGWDGGDNEWSRDRIYNSVMADDFARYVIGTNSGSTDWLSLRLDEPVWRSPEERIADLLGEFSSEEKVAWIKFEATKNEVQEWDVKEMFAAFRSIELEAESNLEVKAPARTANRVGRSRDMAEQELHLAKETLEAVLTKAHSQALITILAEEADPEKRSAPRFDLRLVQHYVLKRVFDLGWTTERFGAFDRHVIGYNGREASKAERIGKKYQWIAYHEILALIADHFQFREGTFGDDGKKAYEGPWHDFIRDIDPSFTQPPTRPVGEQPSDEVQVWWDTAKFDRWGVPDDPRSWALGQDGLPGLDTLLRVANPKDASHWLNVQGSFHWKQEPPPDREPMEAERRELWMMFTGYLLPAADAGAFLKWAKTVSFWGRWMPDPPEFHHMFLGEHGWAPAYQHTFQGHGEEPWVRPENGCPTKIRLIGCSFLNEASGFDCSMEKSQRLQLPAGDLLTGLGLKWTGQDADYIDSSGRLGAFDPSATADGPDSLLIREDLIKAYLEREGLALCWAVIGEKQYLAPGWDSRSGQHELQISGAYVLRQDGPQGFVQCRVEG